MFDENGTLIFPPGVELWSAKGLDQPEITRRITERSDIDCEFAFNVLKASPVGTLLLNLLISEFPKFETSHQMIENDAKRIKDVSAAFREKFGPDNPVVFFFAEVHALAIEHLFREKKKFLAANS